MKKIVFILLALVLVLPFAVNSCYADNNCNNKIEKAVCEMENVKDCKVLIYNQYCFVAIRPQNIKTKTEMQELKQAIKETVISVCPKIEQVCVTASVKAFATLEKAKSEDLWEFITQIFEIEDNQRIQPMPHRS